MGFSEHGGDREGPIAVVHVLVPRHNSSCLDDGMRFNSPCLDDGMRFNSAKCFAGTWRES